MIVTAEGDARPCRRRRLLSLGAHRAVASPYPAPTHPVGSRRVGIAISSSGPGRHHPRAARRREPLCERHSPRSGHLSRRQDSRTRTLPAVRMPLKCHSPTVKCPVSRSKNSHDLEPLTESNRRPSPYHRPTGSPSSGRTASEQAERGRPAAAACFGMPRWRPSAPQIAPGKTGHLHPDSPERRTRRNHIRIMSLTSTLGRSPRNEKLNPRRPLRADGSHLLGFDRRSAPAGSRSKPQAARSATASVTRMKSRDQLAFAVS